MPSPTLTQNKLSSPRVVAAAHGRAPDIPALTSVRFFLALIVVVIHYKRQVSAVGLGFMVEHLSDVVTGFFLLSGFLLTYQYTHSGWHSTASDFWKARIARILPIYWFLVAVALAVIPIWFYVTDASQWPLVIATNVLLCQSWFTSTDVYFGVIPPAYTLSAEALFYLMFPAVMITLSRWRLWLGGTAALALGLPVLAVYSVADPNLATYAYGVCPLTRVFEFVCGCLLARLYLRYKDCALNRRMMPLFTLVGTFGFLYFISPFGRSPFLDSMGRVLIFGLLFDRAVALVVYASLIWSLANERSTGARLLCLPPLVLLGEASYALFLVHDLVVRFLLFHAGEFPPMPAGLRFALYVLVSVVLALAAHCLVERPWRRMLLLKFFGKVSSVHVLLKSRWRPVFASVVMTTVIVAVGCNWKEIYCMTSVSQAAPLAGSNDIAFGTAQKLKQAYFRRRTGDGELFLRWEAGSESTRGVYLNLVTLDDGAKTIWTATKVITPRQPRAAWHETFTVPNSAFVGAKEFALTVSDKKAVLPVSRGRLDWAEHRLLISLSGSVGTVK